MDNKLNKSKAKGIISRKQDMSDATRKTPDGIQIIDPTDGRVTLEFKKGTMIIYGLA